MSQLAQVPGASHVSWSAGPDARGQWWIFCSCANCGPSYDWQKPCSQPDRTGYWVKEFARMHGRCGGRR